MEKNAGGRGGRKREETERARESTQRVHINSQLSYTNLSRRGPDRGEWYPNHLSVPEPRAGWALPLCRILISFSHSFFSSAIKSMTSTAMN